MGKVNLFPLKNIALNATGIYVKFSLNNMLLFQFVHLKIGSK